MRRLAELREGRQRRAAKTLALLLDARRICDRPASQPSLDEIDRAPLDPGERRTQISKELAPPSVEPGEPQDAEERTTERGFSEACMVLDREGDPERHQDGVEGRPPPLDGVANDRNPVRRRPAADQLQDLRCDKLDRPSR